jgi:hypothetical protein
MADLGDHQTSPTDLEESQSIVGNNEPRGIKRQRASIGDDDSDEGDKNGRERRKIEIKFISDKSRRHITFSKRKAGIMKKVGAARRGCPAPWTCWGSLCTSPLGVCAWHCTSAMAISRYTSQLCARPLWPHTLGLASPPLPPRIFADDG